MKCSPNITTFVGQCYMYTLSKARKAVSEKPCQRDCIPLRCLFELEPQESYFKGSICGLHYLLIAFVCSLSSPTYFAFSPLCIQPHHKMNTGKPCFIALYCVSQIPCFFYKVQFCGNPALSKSVSNIFSTQSDNGQHFLPIKSF